MVLRHPALSCTTELKGEGERNNTSVGVAMGSVVQVNRTCFFLHAIFFSYIHQLQTYVDSVTVQMHRVVRRPRSNT